MTTAIWNGTVVARSYDTVVVEGNHYFPLDSIAAVLHPTASSSVCPIKGTARYLDVEVAGQRNPGAAWTYPQPNPVAASIQGRVAFWRGVVVTDD